MSAYIFHTRVSIILAVTCMSLLHNQEDSSTPANPVLGNPPPISKSDHLTRNFRKLSPPLPYPWLLSNYWTAFPHCCQRFHSSHSKLFPLALNLSKYDADHHAQSCAWLCVCFLASILLPDPIQMQVRGRNAGLQHFRNTAVRESVVAPLVPRICIFILGCAQRATQLKQRYSIRSLA